MNNSSCRWLVQSIDGKVLSAMPILAVYVKEACDLCEAAILELQEHMEAGTDQARFTLEVRDIEDNSDWFERYKWLVPVFELDDVRISHYYFDPDKLEEALTSGRQ
ncbi:MAG: glutaredoxin family protein [Pseudomonadota bacterium]